MKIKLTKYDRRFSQLIRTRDVCCQRCLTQSGKLECSHIQSRRHKALRHDTRNAKLLCFRCHRHWHESPLEAVEWLLGIIGQDNYDKLRYRAGQAGKAPTKFEMDRLYEEMAQEIKYLESIPEEERVHLQFRNRYK